MIGVASKLWNFRKFLTSHPLARAGPGSGTSRFIRWQLGTRLLAAPMVMSFVNQSRLIVRRGMTGATGNVYLGLMEFEDMSFVLHFLRPDELFGDVGANVGVYTVLATGVAKARSISVEPLPESVSAMRDNLRINDISDRVYIVQVAAGEAEGEIRFTAHMDTMNQVVLADQDVAGELIVVPMSTIDRIFESEAPALLKIDIEGYELPALLGGSGTLSSPSCQAIIVEINGSGLKYGIEDGQIDDSIRSFGFEPVKYDPRSRTLTRLQTFGQKTLSMSKTSTLRQPVCRRHPHSRFSARTYSPCPYSPLRASASGSPDIAAWSAQREYYIRRGKIENVPPPV